MDSFIRRCDNLLSRVRAAKAELDTQQCTNRSQRRARQAVLEQLPDIVPYWAYSTEALPYDPATRRTFRARLTEADSPWVWV